MSVNIYRKVPPALLSSALLSGALLSACAGTPREILQAPGYAVPHGTEFYSVQCGGREILVNENSLQVFYEEDGSQKSARAFCDQNSSLSLIR